MADGIFHPGKSIVGADHDLLGSADRRRGRVSARATDEAEAAWVAEMFRTRNFDVRIKHFHEQIVGRPMASGKPDIYRSYRQLVD